MPDGKDMRDRSLSGDFDDSDIDSPLDGTHPPGKPGRKKNPNSQAARRDQNRIAQREFRLRKQQRIRDLEARVEILSGGKDEALGEMRNILKDLMEENQTLRNLLRSLSAFIGEGAGGMLPKLGWDMADFNNFVNRSETDTAWESYQRRKKPQAQPATSASSGSQTQKRPAEDDFQAGPSKKTRGPNDPDSERDRTQDGYSLLVPLNSAVPNIYPTSSRSAQDNGIFSELMRGSSGSPMFMQPSTSSNTSNQYSAPPSSNLSAFQPYMPPMNIVENSNSISSVPFPSNGSVGSQQRRMSQTNQQLTPEQIDEDDDPKRSEAYKLVRYHLDNYKRNSAYCLPSSLRPTLVQRTVPHESVIDRILHPELRDRMILLRGRFDLVDCLIDYRAAVTIHGDDVLAHGNWEIGDSWLHKYGFLIDQATLTIANRWRRERGEAEIRMSDIAPTEPAPSST